MGRASVENTYLDDKFLSSISNLLYVYGLMIPSINHGLPTRARNNLHSTTNVTEARHKGQVARMKGAHPKQR